MTFPDFRSDYLEGAAPEILERLIATNKEKTVGYGLDIYTESAKEKIKAACEAPEARVYLLSGGTQTNAVVLSALLAPYEGVVSADTGHIASHEAGAIEATGHKVLTVPNKDGKLTADRLLALLCAYEDDESREHTVKPGAVYISHPTEYGTLYSKEELLALSDIAHSRNMPLFLDGAGLGYALAAGENDLSLPDIAALCDVFYIGGTKCGALFGEAVVITNPRLCPHFFSTVKQRGALLAKGRMLGLQFDTLFTDGLYFKICKNALTEAEYMKNELIKLGFKLHVKSPTNQQFFVVDEAALNKMRDKVGFTLWEKLRGGKAAIRLVTSFMTTREQVTELIEIMKNIGENK